MDIRFNIADSLRRQIRDYGKPLAQFAEDFDIPLTSLKSYIKGNTNLRADTIDLLAKKLKLSPAALISGVPSNRETASTAVRIPDAFAGWPQARQERFISLVSALEHCFSEQDTENGYLQ